MMSVPKLEVSDIQATILRHLTLQKYLLSSSVEF